MKPILFNTEMVQAILDGRKTTTRRVIKPQCRRNFIGTGIDGKPAECRMIAFDEQEIVRHVERPYQPGDILYVRETWCDLPVTPGGHMHGHDVIYYKADGDLRPENWRGNWRPSIHMPKAAARIFLRVTDVRAERLREITEDGAKAEGLVSTAKPTPDGLDYAGLMAYDQFPALWNSTIKKSDLDKYGWAANPWVWVISFERCEKP